MSNAVSQSDSDNDEDLQISSSDKSVDHEANESSNDGVLMDGEEFKSFKQFKLRLQKFQDSSYCAYYQRDSVTIERCRRRGVTQKRIAKPLKYYTVHYCCIQGGKHRKTTSTGQRSASTFQKGCPASFRLKINKDGDALVVSGVNMDHNHECSQNLYRHLPQTRRLKPEDKKKVANLLGLDANRKKVKQQIEAETNKIVLKDLSNMTSRSGDKNNLAATVKMFEEKYGKLTVASDHPLPSQASFSYCTFDGLLSAQEDESPDFDSAECHVYEEANMFKGLFFVTDAMKSAMKAFPEFVGIDATFKLSEIRAPVYLTIVEDSEGCSEIVSGCILLTEDEESMFWYTSCFKAAHPSWEKIKCVMADKDLLERDVIKASFPSANVLICIFHSLRTFNREITCDKLGITPGQRDNAKEIFRKMVYAKTEDHHMQLYDDLKNLPKSILTYSDNNWHGIRDEWTLSTNYMQNNFLNTTNNRIESLNAKINSVVKRYSSVGTRSFCDTNLLRWTGCC